ncbi:MAG: alanine racemase [Synergistaceae bacterium]|jgi:alanine racemase|nr:alanine racemase [Synergistaceae bacterium]
MEDAFFTEQPYAGLERLRPTRLEIDAASLRGNYRNIQKYVGLNCRIIGVVKGDAYSLGLLTIARILREEGCGVFAVATPEEALALRRGGFQEDILVMGASPRVAAEPLIRNNVICACGDLDFALAMKEAAERVGRPARVHVKIDSGMGRTGFLPDQAVAAAPVLRDMGLSLEGAFTHFAVSEEPNPDYTLWQFGRFMAAVGEMRAAGVELPLLHACNSVAITRYPQMHLGAVRPGNLFYGLPKGEKNHFPQLPSIAVKTALSAVRVLPPNSGIGYGLRYMTRGVQRIGVMPMGFYDGFARFQRNPEVLIGGRRAPVVGAICMDQTMIDLSQVPDAKVDDEVVVIGRQGEEEITVEEVAKRIDSVLSQVLSLFTHRVPRVVLNEGNK